MAMSGPKVYESLDRLNLLIVLIPFHLEPPLMYLCFQALMKKIFPIILRLLLPNPFSFNSNFDDDKNNEPYPKILQSIKASEEKKTQPVNKDFKMINLDMEEQLQEIKIGITMTEEEIAHLTELLKGFQEEFAWSYEDMTLMNPEVVQHKIPLIPKVKPHKQKLSWLRPEQTLKTE